MRIANIVCTFPPYRGGMGGSAYDFTKILNKNYKITTLTSKCKDDKNTPKDCGEVKRFRPLIKYGNGGFYPGIFFELKKFDHIFLQYPFFGTNELVWLYKIFNPKKKLTIFYHMDNPKLALIPRLLSIHSKFILNSLFKMADNILCSSLDYVQNGDIAHLYKEYENKFKEVPFGVDIHRFYPEQKNNEKFTILFVGGLDEAHRFKSVDVLIKAVSKLKNKNWVLNVVGNGSLIKEYKKLAQKLEISHKINFLENKNNKERERYFRQADVFILPSTTGNEAFGIVLVEAMASGTPIIASNFPGIRSVFQDGVQGFRIEPRNVYDLRDKLKILMDNEGKRNKMAKEARKNIKENYSMERLEKNLSKVFNH